jgi:hypothetical protein
VRGRNPDVVFLMETKMSIERMELLRKRFGFFGGVAFPANGLSGGLCLWWRKGIVMNALRVTKNVCEMVVRGDDREGDWILYGVYGPPYANEYQAFWDSMSVTTGREGRPWVLVGDLNQISSAGDKSGGRAVSWRASGILRNFLDMSGGVDLGAVDGHFTWSDGRDPSVRIRERLDRAIASPEWMCKFGKAGVKVLPMVGSDHAPIVLDCFLHEDRGKKPFRFFEAWAHVPECRDIVSSVWLPTGTGSGGGPLMEKTRRVGKLLQQWQAKHWRAIQRSITDKEKELLRVQNARPSVNSAREVHLQNEILELNRNVEKVWRQRSREIWLKDGDANTRFFHTSTIIRRKRNFIGSLKREDGSFCRSREEIGKHLLDSFGELFKAKETHFPRGLEGVIDKSIGDEDNRRIEAIPTEAEIKKTVWNMAELKAPGPDGLQGIFYKRYWELVGKSLVDCVQLFFESGTLEENMSFAYIVLIPKSGGADSVNMFRPISLCNFSFKVITRIITSRIRGLLENMISPFQSAFVPGRWIAENTILAREVMHKMKSMKGKGGLVGIKIDMSKAYDRIDWSFLLEVLRCFGFSEKVSKIIEQCVCNASSAILLNGSPLKPLRLERGLRQGDPLSPYSGGYLGTRQQS